MNAEVATTQLTQSTPMQNINQGQGAYPNPIPVEAQQSYAVDDKEVENNQVQTYPVTQHVP
jgi:hypothetical protein